jgi:DnaJ-class molecular chaperone
MTTPQHPDYYEVLGVAKDATPEQIKQAWRKATSVAHPDREGGSAERQQLVNRAYEALSDPERRRQYDENGVDNDAMALEEEGRMQLMELFDRAATNERIDDIVGYVANVLHGRMAECKAEVASAHKIVTRLKKVRLRVKVKKHGEANMFHAIVDKKIANVQGTIPQNERLHKVMEASLKILAAYESVPDLPEGFAATDAQLLTGSIRRFIGGPKQ